MKKSYHFLMHNSLVNQLLMLTFFFPSAVHRLDTIDLQCKRNEILSKCHTFVYMMRIVTIEELES